MDAAALEVLGLLMRWVHITSVALIVGGVAYARLVVFPATAALSPMEKAGFAERIAERYRPLIYGAAAGTLVSGFYNFFTHGGHTRYYHMWFGIKMLLVAHVLAVAVMIVKPPTGRPQDDSRRARQMAGLVISSLVIIVISGYLRRIY